MEKKPPINSKLNVCKNLKWTEHFEPQRGVDSSLSPSLRGIHPYPDLSTVIQLCRDSYKDQPDPETIPNSYKRIWSVSTSSLNGGYFGAIYVNESTEEVLLVHRGTRSKAALKADADILFKKVSRQMLSAMTCTHQLKCKMEESFPNWKLIIAGHSLGSYLTDVSIFSYMYLEPNECGTFHKRNDHVHPNTVTILPYGIGIDGPGSFDIIMKLRDMTDVRYGNGEHMRVNDLPVDHYVRAPNLVNSKYKQVGGLFQIRNESEKISTMLEFLDKCFGKISTHTLDNFISAFTGNDLPQFKQIIDFPKTQSERASFHSNTPRNVDRMDGDYALERYQITDLSKETTELRFFCSHVQKLLYDFDKVKLYTSQWTFLLENVSAEDREFIASVLTSLRVDERNAILVCSADGMSKQKLIPWINEFFISYPHFIDRETVICSMCPYVFPYQTRLQFRRDPFNMKLDSKLPHIIEAGNTSIAASEVVATLEHLHRKYFLLKSSQIELLEKIFKFDGFTSNYGAVVVEVDNEHDTANFIRNFNSSKIIIIKYFKDAQVVRCKVDDLTDKCIEDLLSTELRLHGERLTLHDFVTPAKITNELLHSLLRGGLNNITEYNDVDTSSGYVDIERRLKDLDDLHAPKITAREAMKRSKILIITDLPGSGKTTMVTKLSLQQRHWVIKVKLNKKSSILEMWDEEDRNIANSTPEDLLSELAGMDPLLRPLLKCVIDDWESVVKICVICDAFDEVRADYDELVIEFLKKLRHERKISNIIVTTRPHLKSNLEQSLQTQSCPLGQVSFDELDQLHRKDMLINSLHTKSGTLNRFSDDALMEVFLDGKIETFVELLRSHSKDTLDIADRTRLYCLDTFSNEEGIEFMTKIIDKPNYPSEKVKRIFEKFARNIDTDVRQTPMMLQLIAGKMQDLNEGSAGSLSIHSLYSDHIEHIFRQYVELKAGAQNNSEITIEIQEILFSTNLDFYYYFAVKEVLYMSEDAIELFGLRQPCSDTERERILRHGLVVGTDSSFQFKHRTYAEFFVAKWLLSDNIKPQAHKTFVDVISNKRVAGNNILVFLEGEAAKLRSTADGIHKIHKRKRKFFEQMAEHYCTQNAGGIISSERKMLTRYIFDGIKMFCDENTLQKVLLRGNGSELIFETETMDHFNFVLAMYHEAGLTTPSGTEPMKPNAGGLYQVLRSNFEKIVNFNVYNEDYLFALLKLIEEHLYYDDVLQLIKDLNKKHMFTVHKLPSDIHIKIFKWQIQFLRTSNREDELRKLIFDTNHEGIHSLFLCYPHIVHQSLKEMNSPVLNVLPNVFEAINDGHSTVWESVTLENNFDFKSMRYVCLVMFPDQYGDNAANVYRVQFLDHNSKMLKFILNEFALCSIYASVAALMLEMAILSGLSDEDVETVIDSIFHCTRDANCLSDHLFTFAELGSAIAMKKLLSRVLIESSPDIICTYTVDINEINPNGRTALQIAQMYDDNKHKAVVNVIKEHIRERGDHGQYCNPWTFVDRN